MESLKWLEWLCHNYQGYVESPQRSKKTQIHVIINLIKIGILDHQEQNKTTASFQYNLKTCNF